MVVFAVVYEPVSPEPSLRNREFSEKFSQKQASGGLLAVKPSEFYCDPPLVARRRRHFPVIPQKRRLKRDYRRCNVRYHVSKPRNT